MSRTINLNADIGEGCADDEALLGIVRSASIACGFHAGGHALMHRLARAAEAHGVSIGAHPGFEDRAHFGRREIAMEPLEIETMVAYQIGAMTGAAAVAGARVTHVKAHGALYNWAARDAAPARAIARAVRSVDPSLVVVAPAGSEMHRAARLLGLAVAREAFPDRGYGDDGGLVPRERPGAVIADPEEVAERACRIALDREIETISGVRITVPSDTLCIHGDQPNAAAVAAAVRRALERRGVAVVPLTAMRLRETTGA